MNTLLTLTPALSHPMGEGESSPVCQRTGRGRNIRELSDCCSLSPLGERVRVRGNTVHIPTEDFFLARL